MTFHEKFNLFKQGAEGRLYRGIYLGKPTVVKERFTKKYRHPDLDNEITKQRIKNEAKSIMKCKLVGISTPAIYLVDLTRRRIYMEDIPGSITVKEYLKDLVKNKEPNLNKKLHAISKQIGQVIGKLHANDIIHGDLTTSNMLIVNPQDNLDSKIVFIDFGLSYIQHLPEDKGVDLYVLERAILSTHTEFPEFFNLILCTYKKGNAKDAKEVLNKLDEVRARGRKRTMVG